MITAAPDLNSDRRYAMGWFVERRGRSAAGLRQALDSACLARCVFGLGALCLRSRSDEETFMIYEIRNYHFEPSLMAEYKAWAKDSALPYIRANVDLVGFWTNIDERPEVTGRPLDELGSATVTWIIRWPDVNTRHETMARIFATPEWTEISQGNPGRQHYHRVEAKFAEEL